MFKLYDIGEKIIARLEKLGVEGGEVVLDTDTIPIPLARTIVDAGETILPFAGDEIIVSFRSDAGFISELKSMLFWATSSRGGSRLAFWTSSSASENGCVSSPVCHRGRCAPRKIERGTRAGSLGLATHKF